MSFTSYLIRKFDFSHENIFYKKFSESLHDLYQDKSGEHILIGNISCNGHQLDAIFIASGQISVIDFKDYQGELTFSENNPWRIRKSDGELLFVQGGAQMRNPFQQVRAYRFSLMEYLSNQGRNIFKDSRADIKWDHIGCIVFFQGKIIFNENDIPGNINRYFHIADISSIINLLDSRYSKKLVFSDNEVNSILSALDVRPENQLKNHVFDIEKKIAENSGAEKLSLIKRLIQGTRTDSTYSRIINYYKTLINVERFKEPSASALHPFPLAIESDITAYSLNLSASKEFHALLLKNFEEKFPQNLFVALNILIDGNSIPLLHTIILSTDIKSKDVVKLNFNEFELYNKALESMGLAEDILEELSTSINTAKTLERKLSFVRDILGVSAELTKTIKVGLSTESLFSIQLVSELNSLSKNKEENISNKVFKGFIQNTSVPKGLAGLKLDPYVQITPLNNSQEKAIRSSFSQPLTVITGPPGTGKSQVVSNILANAIVNGHSVLFASKNNRAIDNVKERMEELLQESYLLRLGSKNEINENVKPLLTKILSRKNQGVIKDNSEKLQATLDGVRNDHLRSQFLKCQLKKIPQLQQEVIEQDQLLESMRNSLEKWLSNIDSDFKRLFVDSNNFIEVDNNELALLIKKIEKWKRNYFSKLLFNWFHRAKFESIINNVNKAQQGEVYEFIQLKFPWVDPNHELLDSSKDNLSYLIELKNVSTKLIRDLQSIKNEMEKLEISLINVKNELTILLASRESHEAEIFEIINQQPDKGLKALNGAIQKKLFSSDASNIQRYLDYIPSTVWKDKEVEDFYITSRKFVSEFNAICITSLSVKNSFPLSEEIFDLLVIDEASQCDIASALPMIYRSKRVVIIGDPLQLKHITSVQRHEEKYIIEGLALEKQQLDYVSKSLFDYSFALSNKSTLEGIFLDEHYRCHPEIINFSNTNFYERRLGQSMKIHTASKVFKYGKLGMNWVNVNGSMHESKNINVAEVNKCVDLANSLANQYPDASIGIITPFKDQHKAISEKLPQAVKERVKPDTVHRYQGDEKDIIILSLVVTDNSPSSKARFINSNDYLLNVAITRARSSLYIVGDYDYCTSLRDNKIRTPLSLLADYAKSIGKIT